MPHATRLAQITRARLRAGTSVRVALAPNSAFTSRTGRVKSVLLCDDPAQNILMAANSNSTPSWHSNRICATTATGLWTTAQGRAKIAAAGWANSQLGQQPASGRRRRSRFRVHLLFGGGHAGEDGLRSFQGLGTSRFGGPSPGARAGDVGRVGVWDMH
jgi:hypothetical protein